MASVLASKEISGSAVSMTLNPSVKSLFILICNKERPKRKRHCLDLGKREVLNELNSNDIIFK